MYKGVMPKRMDIGDLDLEADRRIISKRCMVEYIPSGNSELPLNSVRGDKLREKMEGSKSD
jgi:hypothetical protein